MLSNPIESEIEVEHKVFRDFNMRQLICLLIGGAIALCMYIFFRDVMLMVIFSLPFATILGYMSRKDDYGRPAEEILKKRLERSVYKNDKRTIRTKNRYVALLNRGYADLRKGSKQGFSVKRVRDQRAVNRRKNLSDKKSIK